MAAILALTAAAAYGIGDFLGGMASRREPSTAVVLWSHVVGLLVLAVAAPIVGEPASAPRRPFRYDCTEIAPPARLSICPWPGSRT
jgi:ABC-type branched-subunit amino acid transport system permease subunit